MKRHNRNRKSAPPVLVHQYLDDVKKTLAARDFQAADRHLQKAQAAATDMRMVFEAAQRQVEQFARDGLVNHILELVISDRVDGARTWLQASSLQPKWRAVLFGLTLCKEQRWSELHAVILEMAPDAYSDPFDMQAAALVVITHYHLAFKRGALAAQVAELAVTFAAASDSPLLPLAQELLAQSQGSRPAS